MTWVAVVPVKGGPGGKSRLAGHPERARLADAFALDTVSALLAAPGVAGVVVVTADGPVAARLSELGAVIVVEAPRSRAPATDPLNAAIVQGIDAARARFPQCGIAVVAGDLPALRSADVETALGLAAAHERAMLPDAAGTGTTALFALAGVPLRPRFGPGSRAAHEAAGHVPLPLPGTASIRRDVDTVDDLAEALGLGVGRYTSALIASTAAAIDAVEGTSRIHNGTAAERMPAAPSAGTAEASASSTSQASSRPPEPREP